jgi:hypothetical protein
VANLASLQEFHRRSDFTFLRLHRQSVFSELPSSPWADQELYIGTALHQLPAEVPTERTGTQDQKSHASHRTSLLVTTLRYCNRAING